MLRSNVLRGLPIVFLTAACATGGGPNLTRPPSAQHQLLLELPCRGGVALAPDGTLVATSNGWALELRAVPGGVKRARHELRLGADAPTGVVLAWSPDGRFVAASARGETSVLIVDVQDGSERRADLAHGRASALAFARGSGELAIGTDEGWIERVDVATAAARGAHELARRAANGPLGVAFLGFAADDRILLASSARGGVAALDPARFGSNGAETVIWRRDDDRPLALDSAGKRLLTAGIDRAEARVLDLADPRVPSVLVTLSDPAGTGTPEFAAWCGGTDRFAVAFTRSFVLTRWLDAEFFALAPENGTLRAEHVGGVRIGAPWTLAGDASGRWLAIGAPDGAVVYDASAWFEGAR